MRYLKRINESFSERTLNVLDGFGISKESFLEMINFLGRLGYTDIKHNIPFIEKMYGDNPDYTIGYDEMRRLINFYEKKRKETEKVDKVEDYFLDLIESDSNIKVKFKLEYSEADVTIMYKDLSDISDSIKEIEKRFERAKVNYRILSISHSNNSSIVFTFKIM